jgi:hypothetical protein
VDISILDRASTLFTCCDSWGCKTLLPYPDIFEHEHVKELATLSPYTLCFLQPEAPVMSMAILLLKCLGLSEDTPSMALVELKGRFVCLCGHPRYLKPMDFGTLVSGQALVKAVFAISDISYLRFITGTMRTSGMQKHKCKYMLPTTFMLTKH